MRASTDRMIAAVATHAGCTADSTAALPWWSYGKVVLAAAALALVARGRLALDDALPGHGFTLRALLQHRAGLPDYGMLRSYHDAVAAGEQPWPVAELLERVRACPAPSSWLYSNVGYLLVRQVIEDTEQAPLGEALGRLVFTPLGVEGVTVAQTPADLAATAWGNERGYHPGWVYHGLLLGPACSAALLLHRLLDGALLPPALLDAMCAAHPVGGPVPGRPWQSAGYGLGLMIGEGVPAGRYIGHTGGGPGSTCAVYRREDRSHVAAAFVPLDDPAEAERRALALSAAPP